jgi:hypothetical protein
MLAEHAILVNRLPNEQMGRGGCRVACCLRRYQQAAYRNQPVE